MRLRIVTAAAFLWVMLGCVSPSSLKDAVDSAVTATEARRAEEGKPASIPLGTREWIEIGGSALLAILGAKGVVDWRKAKAQKKAPSTS